MSSTRFETRRWVAARSSVIPVSWSFVCAIAPARFACELLSWAISCFWSRSSAGARAAAPARRTSSSAVDRLPGRSRRARRTARRGRGSTGWRGGGGIGGQCATAGNAGLSLGGSTSRRPHLVRAFRVWRCGGVRSARTSSRPPDLAPPQRALPRRPVPGFRAVYQRGQPVQPSVTRAPRSRSPRGVTAVRGAMSWPSLTRRRMSINGQCGALAHHVAGQAATRPCTRQVSTGRMSPSDCSRASGANAWQRLGLLAARHVVNAWRALEANAAVAHSPAHP